MAIELPDDFLEFLRLLSERWVEVAEAAPGSSLVSPHYRA
jgi:hypothetical protein